MFLFLFFDSSYPEDNIVLYNLPLFNLKKKIIVEDISPVPSINSVGQSSVPMRRSIEVNGAPETCREATKVELIVEEGH